MKSKAVRRYYMITALILAGAAVVPTWNFAGMLSGVLQDDLLPYDAALVVPFMAVATALLAGFLFLPLLWNMPERKQRVILTAGATLIFLGMEHLVEMVAARRNALNRVLTMRRWIPPEERAVFAREASFPPGVRPHYYIFSIILILAVLYLLYNIAQNVYGNAGQDKRRLILQGVATACYLSAYLLVEVMRYENYETRWLTHASVLNAALCFILAALVVGLYSGSFLRPGKYRKLLPPLLSALTVLALYCAEYAMLGDFYLYDENIVVTLMIRALIVIFPSVMVYYLQRFALKT